jgi:hypothetical protein
MLAGNVLARLHDLGDAAIAEREAPFLSALALKLEADFGAFDPDMAVAQRRQAVAAVAPRIISVADADQRRFEQMDRRRQNFFARQPALAHVGVDPRADRGKHARKTQYPLVFGLFAARSERRMIPILLASPQIAPCGLDMAVRRRADPDIRPGGRNDETAQPRQPGLVGDALAARIAIRKSLAGLVARDAGFAVGDVKQSRSLGFRRKSGVGRTGVAIEGHGPRIRGLPDAQPALRARVPVRASKLRATRSFLSARSAARR